MGRHGGRVPWLAHQLPRRPGNGITRHEKARRYGRRRQLALATVRQVPLGRHTHAGQRRRPAGPAPQGGGLPELMPHMRQAAARGRTLGTHAAARPARRQQQQGGPHAIPACSCGHEEGAPVQSPRSRTRVRRRRRRPARPVSCGGC